MLLKGFLYFCLAIFDLILLKCSHSLHVPLVGFEKHIVGAQTHSL